MKNIDNLTYKELKEINNLFGGTSHNEYKNNELNSLIGEQVTFFCLNYIYHGELISFDDESLKIKNPKIVYETGAFNEKGFKDAQSLECPEFNIQRGVVESFGVLTLKND